MVGVPSGPCERNAVTTPATSAYAALPPGCIYRPLPHAAAYGANGVYDHVIPPP